ncbi:hypothetical protein [Allobaculum mucilyticum]|uniref:hypothetical protein n=2 Tax=Allobaculum mucilyticum TaxID=2834459 RepID=UPI001E536502|nr:hypothetical protein [Allobaculum mucilyticum]
MKLSQEEMRLLSDLIGSKAERVIYPIPSSSLSKPVETVLVLAPDKGILIDSCYRSQNSVETPVSYPQMRVRMINTIPEYPNGQAIDLNEFGGEIIASIEVTNESILTATENASYTKAVHIEFSGAREVTITRETYRTPSLEIYEKIPPVLTEYETGAQIIRTVETF